MSKKKPNPAERINNAFEALFKSLEKAGLDLDLVDEDAEDPSVESSPLREVLTAAQTKAVAQLEGPKTGIKAIYKTAYEKLDSMKKDERPKTIIGMATFLTTIDSAPETLEAYENDHGVNSLHSLLESLVNHTSPSSASVL